MAVKWKTYEQVAQFLLNEMAAQFGLGRVEGKQIIPGDSGTNWEIDAKGVRAGDEGCVIIECRRYTKDRVPQDEVGGLAYRIRDSGAAGGIVVSPLGLQHGSALVAAHSGIRSVRLAPDSTDHELRASVPKPDFHRYRTGGLENQRLSPGRAHRSQITSPQSSYCRLGEIATSHIEMQQRPSMSTRRRSNQ